MLKRSLVLLLAASTLAWGQAKYKPKGKPVEYDGYFATFPSGLRVVVYEMPHVDRFSVTVSYGSGSAQDRAGKEGLAHVLEHLAYRTAPASLGARVWDRLLAGGFEFNGFTTPDETAYWMEGKPADLGAALAIEAARMRDPVAVSDDDFVVERDVVVSEWRERFETDPQAAQLQWVRELAYPGHPYGRFVAGTPDSLRAITLDDARAWAKTRYVPKNAVVVIISPFRSRDVARQAFEAFGALASEPAAGGPDEPPAAFTSPALGEAPMVTRTAPIANPVLWVAWPVPGSASGRTAVGRAAAFGLDLALSGVNSRGQNGAAALEAIEGAGTMVDVLHASGLLVARVELRKASDAEKVAAFVKDRAFDLRRDMQLTYGSGARGREGFTNFTRSALQMEAYLAMENIDGVAVARFLRATGKPDFLAGWNEELKTQLQGESVIPFATQHLRREQAVTMLVVPDSGALARSVVGSGRSGERADDAGDVGVPPPPAEALAVAKAPGLDRAERRVLQNGVNAMIVKRGSLPIAEVRVVVRTSAAGTDRVPAGVPQLALSSNYARHSGTALTAISASSGERFESEHLVHQQRGSSANLDVLVESAAEWAKDQKLRWYEFVKPSVLRHLEREGRDPFVRARRELLQGLFPSHPYAAVPQAAAVDDIPRSVVAAYLRDEIRPERATVIVVSDQDPTPELWALVEESFGSWRRGAAERAATAEPPLPAARRILLVDRPGATQAVIAAGFRAPPLSRRDAAAQEALASLFRSRLNQRLRVEQGVSYGAYVEVIEHEQGAALLVGTAVDRDATADALAFVLAVPKDLAAQAPFAADAGRARWQVARSFGFRFDTVRASADALEELAKHGFPPDRFEKLPADIAALDAARIQKAAAALGLGRESVVVLADAATVAPQLQATGFTVEVVR
jgi:zinc protease